MTATVLIPSYYRPLFLSQCLEHVLGQTRMPDEIVVCVRDDDAETARVLAARPEAQIKAACTSEQGVIAAMNAGIAVSNGDIIALLDDDAYPRPDWLERIVATFEQDQAILGVGGIDVQPNPDNKIPKGKSPPVGTISWYGQLRGNHHLGSGSARRVTLLKGCNCAYRGEFLRRVGIDPHLRGKGAQVGWEISLGFDAMNDGGALFYDPSIVVDHRVAPRMDENKVPRGSYNADAAYDMVWNFFSIVRRKAPRGLGIRITLWEFAVGSKPNPGVFRIVDRRIGGFRERLRRIKRNFKIFRDTRSCEAVDSTNLQARSEKSA